MNFSNETPLLNKTMNAIVQSFLEVQLELKTDSYAVETNVQELCIESGSVFDVATNILNCAKSVTETETCTIAVEGGSKHSQLELSKPMSNAIYYLLIDSSVTIFHLHSNLFLEAVDDLRSAVEKLEEENKLVGMESVSLKNSFDKIEEIYDEYETLLCSIEPTGVGMGFESTEVIDINKNRDLSLVDDLPEKYQALRKMIQSMDEQVSWIESTVSSK